MANHLHIDPFSGIAGDMFLGAALHLGVPLEALNKALASLPLDPLPTLEVTSVKRHGIGAVDLKVVHPTLDHHHHHDHHPDHDHDHRHDHHHHVGRRQILAMIDKLDASDRAKQRAAAIVNRLAEAEARVHGMSVDEVHFHEVGAVDSIVDMLGAAVATDLLDVDTFSCGPLPISRGFVKCDHGRMPVPAPAAAYLMEGLATIGVDRCGELVTPTGAAIVAALCSETGPSPAMQIAKIGYGAGDREDPEVPNLLRLILGSRVGPPARTKPQTQAKTPTHGERQGPARRQGAAKRPGRHTHSAGQEGHHH